MCNAVDGSVALLRHFRDFQVSKVLQFTIKFQFAFLKVQSLGDFAS